MCQSNIQRLRKIARALGYLNKRVAYVGGSVVELYINSDITDLRHTLDVDCVIEMDEYKDYANIEKELRSLGFKDYIENGAPICRKTYEEELVDVMPTESNILGFSNMWYKEAMKHRYQKDIGEDVSIYIFPISYFLATKLEAQYTRGGEGDDWRGDKDFEDITNLLNYKDDITTIISTENNSELKIYLADKFANIAN